MYIGLYVQCLFSCQIVTELEFSRQILEKYSNTKLKETRPMGAELFSADRRTDKTKPTVTFRNFVNSLKTNAER